MEEQEFRCGGLYIRQVKENEMTKYELEIYNSGNLIYRSEIRIFSDLISESIYCVLNDATLVKTIEELEKEEEEEELY